MIKILAEESLIEDNYKVNCCFIQLDKGILVLVTDQENYGFSQVVLSTPTKLEGMRVVSSPAPLFGFGDNPLGKTISELVSRKLDLPALVLLHFRGLERKDLFTTKLAVSCVKKALDKLSHS